jgi:adenine-specific DNA methylase
MDGLWNSFFGCWHKHTSFPITSRKNAPQGQRSTIRDTYIVCLDCGKHLPYSWEQMKVVKHKSKAQERLESHTVEENRAGGWLSRHRWSSRET